VKWAGAAYLCFIGIKMLLMREGGPAGEAPGEARACRSRRCSGKAR
jgi:threonine/homoserine/homoserine lactone efflux protein